MEGAELHSGAVVGVNRIRNPIDLAVKVLQESDHCLFSGDGAHQLAETYGFSLVDPACHIHPRERAVWERIQEGEDKILKTAWANQPGDTVGAIARDQYGNLAAGNSTGGILNKAVGRIGDAPLIGSGFYADNRLGAFVCTGWGESIMRSGMGMLALHALTTSSPSQKAGPP